MSRFTHNKHYVRLNAICYCYLLVNVISLSWYRSDHVKHLGQFDHINQMITLTIIPVLQTNQTSLQLVSLHI
jgi:hypothetical protein